MLLGINSIFEASSFLAFFARCVFLSLAFVLLSFNFQRIRVLLACVCMLCLSYPVRWHGVALSTPCSVVLINRAVATELVPGISLGRRIGTNTETD